MRESLTEEQWRTFEEQGYLYLGKVLSDNELAAISGRIDDIMLGKADVDYDRLMMQREAGDGMERTPQTLGFKGASLNYRKVQNLELDPLFMEYIQKPLFREICGKVYGGTAIACFRAMFMNKPAYNGTTLSYHQDRWTDLDRDPQVTVWTALDPATEENGCVRIFPGTHRHLLNPSESSGFLTLEQERELNEGQEPVLLRLEPGEAVLLHNWTVHGSEGNKSSQSRRAFSICYMEAETISKSNETFTKLFDSAMP